MRTFAEQNLHLADANYGLASAVLIMKSPFALGEWEKTGDRSKAKLTEIVMDRYDFVN